MAKVKEKKKTRDIITKMMNMLEATKLDAEKCDEGNAAAGRRVRGILKPMKEMLKEIKAVSLDK